MIRISTIIKRLSVGASQVKFNLVLFFLLMSQVVISQTLYTSGSDLRKAIEAAAEAGEGGEFIVEDNIYDSFSVSLEDIMATEDKPIHIKPQTIGGATLKQGSKFTVRTSSYITIEGFVFKREKNSSPMIKTEGSNHIRITNNVFEYIGSETESLPSSCDYVYIGGVWDDKTYPFVTPSHHNRIDHNTFKNKKVDGNFITIDGSTDEATDVAYQSQYDQIDHNYFLNNSERADNEKESIRIGWSKMSMSSGFTTVEHNLFENCNGDPEIVSVKSCDNTIRYNTFRSSYGSLVLRHGNRNWVEGNYFFGDGKPVIKSAFDTDLYTGGIRVYGKDHVVINNYMEGLTGTRWDAPITLTNGDADNDEVDPNLSDHFIAENVLIAYNTLVNNTNGIEVGYEKGGDYDMEIKNITMANNLISGSENALVQMLNGNSQTKNITWVNNLMQAIGDTELVEGTGVTSFSSSEVTEEDPMLATESINTFTLFRATASTPIYNDATSGEVLIDIDGQSRTASSNPGADYYSAAAMVYMPLTPDDVGAPYDEVLSVNNFESNAIKVYPVPANTSLNIKTAGEPIDRIRVYGLDGRLVIDKKVTHSSVVITLNTSNLSSGTYVVRFTNVNGLNTSKIIVVSH